VLPLPRLVNHGLGGFGLRLAARSELLLPTLISHHKRLVPKR
jgi:hypothetical protein